MFGVCSGRFHAFEIAHNRDRNSSGRGVRQFKTSLLRRLEQVIIESCLNHHSSMDIQVLTGCLMILICDRNDLQPYMPLQNIFRFRIHVDLCVDLIG